MKTTKIAAAKKTSKKTAVLCPKCGRNNHRPHAPACRVKSACRARRLAA